MGVGLRSLGAIQKDQKIIQMKTQAAISSNTLVDSLDAKEEEDKDS